MGIHGNNSTILASSPSATLFSNEAFSELWQTDMKGTKLRAGPRTRLFEMDRTKRRRGHFLLDRDCVDYRTPNKWHQTFIALASSRKLSLLWSLFPCQSEWPELRGMKLVTVQKIGKMWAPLVHLLGCHLSFLSSLCHFNDLPPPVPCLYLVSTRNDAFQAKTDPDDLTRYMSLTWRASFSSRWRHR